MRNFDYSKALKKIRKMTKLKLVPFVLGVTMLTGCSGDKNDNMVKSKPVNWDRVESSKELPEENWYYKPFAKKGYECDFLVKGLFRVKREYDVNYSLNNIYSDDYHREKFYFDNLDEYRNYVEVKNPTYSDVRGVVEENTNISNLYKEYLYESFDNLEKNASDLDLVALYHNVKDLKIVNCTDEDFNNFYGGIYFDKAEKCLKINPDVITKDDFCREVVGKGMMSVTFVDEDEDIEYCYLPTTEVIRADQNNVWGGNFESETLGKRFYKYAVDMIMELATNKKIADDENLSREYFRILCEKTETSLNDFIQGGNLTLMNNMHNKSFRQLYDYLEFSDDNAEFVIERFLTHYAASKLYTNEDDMASIKTDISEVLDSGDSLTLENIEMETLETVETLSNEDELQKVYSKEYEYYDY